MPAPGGKQGEKATGEAQQWVFGTRPEWTSEACPVGRGIDLHSDVLEEPLPQKGGGLWRHGGLWCHQGQPGLLLGAQEAEVCRRGVHD